MRFALPAGLDRDTHADLDPAAIGHGESRIRICSRNSEARAGGCECCRGMGYAKKSVGKRRQASAVAPFDFWPGEEIEQPGIEFRILGHRRARRLATRWSECDRTLIMTKMRGEVADDPEVSVQIASYRGFKAPAAFVEIGLACVETGTETKGVVIGFNGRISRKYLNLRKPVTIRALRRPERDTDQQKQ